MRRAKTPAGAAQNLEQAQAIALTALAFLAEDAARLSRFLTLTGITPAGLRDGAGTEEILVAVLDHLAADESLLLLFCANKSVAAESIEPARARLSGQLRE
jgi:hypothetical protein